MRIQLACCASALFYLSTKKYSGLLTRQKICILLFSLLFSATIFSQKRSNPKIGKDETEVSSFILADDYLAFGGQFVYRLYVTKKLKTAATARNDLIVPLPARGKNRKIVADRACDDYDEGKNHLIVLALIRVIH